MINEEKQKHRIFKCPGCKSDFLHRTKLAMFNLSKFNTYLDEAKTNGLLDINKLQEQTKTLINDLNKSYKHCYNTSFTEVLSTINSSSSIHQFKL